MLKLQEDITHNEVQDPVICSIAIYELHLQAVTKTMIFVSNSVLLMESEVVQGGKKNARSFKVEQWQSIFFFQTAGNPDS